MRYSTCNQARQSHDYHMLGHLTVQYPVTVRYLFTQRSPVIMDQPVLLDDKSAHCIPFILERLKTHDERYSNKDNAPPFFLGLNGAQGAGKTSLVRNHLLHMPNLLLRGMCSHDYQ